MIAGKKYKRVKIYDNYIVYEKGDVVNYNTKQKLSINKQVTLYGKELKKKSVNLKRLIYETWYDVVLTPKDILKFKDGNSTNFHYTNLIHVNGPNKHLNFILDPKKKWKIFKNFDN